MRRWANSAVDGGAKAHIGFDDWHAQLIKKRGHVRIIGIVEHQKPGINGLIPVLARHDRTGVTAKAGCGFKQGDVMVGGEHMGGSHP